MLQKSRMNGKPYVLSGKYKTMLTLTQTRHPQALRFGSSPDKKGEASSQPAQAAGTEEPVVGCPQVRFVIQEPPLHHPNELTPQQKKQRRIAQGAGWGTGILQFMGGAATFFYGMFARTNPNGALVATGLAVGFSSVLTGLGTFWGTNKVLQKRAESQKGKERVMA